MKKISYSLFRDIATYEGISFVSTVDAINNVLEDKQLTDQLAELSKQLDHCDINNEKTICIKNSQGFKRGTSYFIHESYNQYFIHEDFLIAVFTNSSFNSFIVYKK